MTTYLDIDHATVPPIPDEDTARALMQLHIGCQARKDRCAVKAAAWDFLRLEGRMVPGNDVP